MADKPIQESARKRMEKRYSALKKERQQGWDQHWRELAEQFAPRRGRFLWERANDGQKKHQSINNSNPPRALRILASGMMAGLTSPARPWFRLATPDPEMMEFGPVRDWLYQVEVRMREMFAKTNLYKALPGVYTELGAFGTGSLAALESNTSVMRFEPLTIGSYYLAQNDELAVDTLYRERRMTVRQLVTKFGKDNLSERVRAMINSNQFDQWVDVVHVIEPNKNRIYGKLDSQNMPFVSCWYEQGVNESDKDRFLAKSGFNEFPIMAPRWETTGEDVYGSCPAMLALGDAKELQFQMRRKAKAIDKHVDPPMVGDISIKGKRASLVAGDITYADFTKTGGNAGFMPAYTIKPELQALLLDINATEERINDTFYVNLFLMLAMSDRREMTATEVAERHEEKLLMLGPVLESLNDELLDPLIDRAFSIMLRNGLLPPPPEELMGVDLKVEYISILAQAQKMVALGSIDRLIAHVGNAAQADPSVLDKIDFDQTVDEYGEMLGTPPGVIRSDEDVAKLREERARQAQAAQMAASMQQGADIAKTLSETETGDTDALSLLTGS